MNESDLLIAILLGFLALYILHTYWLWKLSVKQEELIDRMNYLITDVNAMAFDANVFISNGDKVTIVDKDDAELHVKIIKD